MKHELKEHEEKDCNLHKVQGLVESHRKLCHKNEHINAQLHFFRQQLSQTTQLLHLQNNTISLLQRANTKRPQSLLNVVEFVFECASSPGRFWREKNHWKNMYISSQARGRIYDVMVSIPTFLYAIKVS